LKQHGGVFGAQLGVVQVPQATMHNLNTAGIDGTHPGDPGDLTVASRIEKSLLSAQSTSCIEQASDAVMLCSEANDGGAGSSKLTVNCASKGILQLMRLDLEQVLGPIDNLFEMTGLSRNGQQTDQALSISRNINAVGPSAVQLLLAIPKPTAGVDAGDKLKSDKGLEVDSHWVLWQVWPVRESNSNDSLRRQIHVLCNMSKEVMSPHPTASLDQMVRCTTAAIDGPLEHLCTACLQLGKLAALPAVPLQVDAASDTPNVVTGWKDLLRDNQRGVRARVEALLVSLPPILRGLASEARKTWSEPLQVLLHTQAASIVRYDPDRVLPATAWQIERTLRQIEHVLDQLARAVAHDA
jgi:hypothetical protein